MHVCMFVHTRGCEQSVCVYRSVYLCVCLFIGTAVRALLSDVTLLSYSGQGEEGNRGASGKAAMKHCPVVTAQSVTWALDLSGMEGNILLSLWDAAASTPGRGLILLCGTSPMVAWAFCSLEWFPLTSAAPTKCLLVPVFWCCLST